MDVAPLSDTEELPSLDEDVESLAVARIQTTQDAFRLVSTRIERFTVFNEDEKDPLVLARHMRAAHALIYTLLRQSQQRDLFLTLASRPKHWPSLGPLFGAPPYAFLRSEDAGLLRATGIARSRVNMAFGADMCAPPHGQFGHGHYVDDHKRKFLVAASGAGTNPFEPPAWTAEAMEDMSLVPLYVCIRRRTRRGARAAVSGATTAMRASQFPLVGEAIELRPTPTVQRYTQSALTPMHAVVVRVQHRSQNALTALCTIRMS